MAALPPCDRVRDLLPLWYVVERFRPLERERLVRAIGRAPLVENSDLRVACLVKPGVDDWLRRQPRLALDTVHPIFAWYGRPWRWIAS